MVQPLFQNNINIERMICVDPTKAKGLEDPARIAILELMHENNNELSADKIIEKLSSKGMMRASTTVRHHLDVLKRAGLIQVTKMEEARGAVIKYYGTSTKILSYQCPDDFEKTYYKSIEDTTKKISKIVDNIFKKNQRNVNAKSSKSSQMTAMSDQNVAVEIINRALTKILEEQNSNVYSENNKQIQNESPKKGQEENKKNESNSAKQRVKQASPKRNKTIPN